jgi:hypothetical protein
LKISFVNYVKLPVVLKNIIFWDMTPCSPLSLPPAFLLVLAEVISSTLKMEAICPSETSVAIQQITLRHIAEGDTLHNHRGVNLKSYIPLVLFAREDGHLRPKRAGL